MNTGESVDATSHPELRTLTGQTASASCAGSFRHRPTRRPLVLLLLTGIVALHGYGLFSLWPILSQGSSDFIAFYSAGQTLHKGLGPKLYDQETLAQVQTEFAPLAVKVLHGALPYTHPPLEASVFALLAPLSYPAAYAIWDIFSAMVLLGSVWLLCPSLRNLRRWSRPLPFLCAFAFFPVFWCLVQGQDSIVLLLLFVCAFLAMKDRRDFLAGVCLALALIKFQYVVPLFAIFLLRRKWKLLAGFSVTFPALVAASVALVGWRATLHYPQVLLLLSRSQGHLAMNPQFMPNLRGAIEGLIGNGSIAANVVLALGSAAAIAFVARRCTFKPEAPTFALEFSLAVTVSALVSFHTFAQDLTIVLLPILLVSEALFGGSIAHGAGNLLRPAIVLLLFSPLYVVLASHSSFALVLFAVTVLFATGITKAIQQDHPAPHTQAGRGLAREHK